MKHLIQSRFALRSLVAVLAMGTASLAFAHAYPVKQLPAAGATVAASQSTVSIEFDDALEPAFSSIAVTDAQGQSATADKSVVDAADHKHMSVTLKPLTPGVYNVAWVAVAEDSHRTHGHYSFTVK